MVNKMKNESIWLEDKIKTNHNKLEKNLETDILIIGGGITGISCAYHLIDSNLKVTLVEANELGSGVTSKTTGKLTFLQEDIYSKITNTSSEVNAKLYYQAQKHAISLVKEIISKNKINCDLEPSPSYLFTNSNDKIPSLKKIKNLLESYSEKVTIKKNFNLADIPCKYAIAVSDCYVFHPLKYLNGLVNLIKNKISIYEYTRITCIKKQSNYFICKTKNHSIKTKKIILALHYPYFLIPYLFPFKVNLEKSYISVTTEKNKNNFNAINLDEETISIRYHKNKNNNYKLYLHPSRNICIHTNDLENFQKNQSISAELKYRWSNIDIITNDYLPYIGEIKDNLYLATGYNIWGMTNGSLAGEIISDLILNRNNQYSDLFNPKRSLKLTKLPSIIGSSIKGYKEGITKNFQTNKNITYNELDGRKIATYQDEKGIKHSVYLKCPHLKCNLIFNEVEKTWDCPCHGSRFNIDGKCLEGPSNYDISVDQTFDNVNHL